ncbi:MAG: tetratricopeptide repeat protein [Gemmatimonadaceae bacterium]|nr:tetratricopeptide repeat protein [Gemmatimonadaceae bacterium]
MVPTLASSDKELGIQAAEAIRARLTRDVRPQSLFVIPKADIYNTLQASGYSTTEALGGNDAKALATLLRADNYIDGSVTRTATGIRIDSRLVLSRDNSISQLLPPADGKLDAAAASVSKNAQSAMKQLEAEGKCVNLVREQKYTEAMAEARKGIAAYPNGTIAGICLGNAFYAANQLDSVLALSQRIVQTDPKNIPALRWLADIYGQRRDPRGVDALLGLMAADPTNVRLVDQVANGLAASGQAARAVPIIMQILKDNPGDPNLLRTGWLVLLAAKDYPQAIQTGLEYARVDTAAADTTYYVKLVGAYAALNQSQQAAKTLQEATARYPNNATLWAVYAQTLQNAGQSVQAAAAAQKAISLNPKVEGGFALAATTLAATGQWDQVGSTLERGAAAGADASLLAKIALKLGNDSYKAGNASKNRADFQRAVSLLKLSDRLDGSADAKFLIGAASFSIGQSAINEAQESKSCALARTSKEAFTTAQENVPAGLASYPDAAKQLLAAIPQFMPAVNAMVTRFCK